MLVLDKNGGQLSLEKHKIFGKYIQERINNHGNILSDVSALFDGPIPPIKSIQNSNINGKTTGNHIANIDERSKINSLEYLSPENSMRHRNMLNSVSNKSMSDDEEDTPISDNKYNSETASIENPTKRLHEDTISTSTNLMEEEIKIRKTKIRKVALSDDEDE